MKQKVFFLLLLLSMALSVSAQKYVGGSFSIVDNSAETYVNISPEFGYNLNNRWAVAGQLGYYHTGGSDIFAFSPYARHTFYEKDILSIFVDGGVDVVLYDSEVEFGIGLKPGIALKLTDHFSFVTKFGFLGYSDTAINRNSGISFNTDNLNIGFVYTW